MSSRTVFVGYDWNIALIAFLPHLHIFIIMKNTIPMVSGIYPPSNILIELDAKNKISSGRMGKKIRMVFQRDHFHR
jgi:hypothetical protein